jgi:hypothetical protein
MLAATPPVAVRTRHGVGDRAAGAIGEDGMGSWRHLRVLTRWPLLRQIGRADALGLGESSFSPRTEARL